MGVQIPTHEGAILRVKGGQPRTYPDMFNGWYTQIDSSGGGRRRAALVQYGCRLGCTGWGAHWRHPVSTTEPSLCGGDAALCRITLTTCYALILFVGRDKGYLAYKSLLPFHALSVAVPSKESVLGNVAQLWSNCGNEDRLNRHERSKFRLSEC